MLCICVRVCDHFMASILIFIFVLVSLSTVLNYFLLFFFVSFIDLSLGYFLFLKQIQGLKRRHFKRRETEEKNSIDENKEKNSCGFRHRNMKHAHTHTLHTQSLSLSLSLSLSPSLSLSLSHALTHRHTHKHTETFEDTLIHKCILINAHLHRNIYKHIHPFDREPNLFMQETILFLLSAKMCKY